MSARIVSPSSVLVSPEQGISLILSGVAPAVSINPSRYAIEVRDKDQRLKYRIEDKVTSVQFEWNRIGGCGRATIKIDAPYSRYAFAADDDIRIYLPNAVSSATLWWRGYLEADSPTLQSGNSGSISLELTGYFSWLTRVIVQASNDQKVYNNMELSLILTDLLNTFVIPNSDITLGVIQAGSFAVDTIQFKTKMRDAVQTLIDLSGAVECGVNENLQFYWYNPVYTLSKVWYISDRIVKLTDRMDFKNIVNHIYFEGGDAGGVTFQSEGLSQSSINRYGIHEEILSNGSITTSSVANQYISNIFRQRSMPHRQLSISLKDIKTRVEATLPIGACSVVDPDTNMIGAIYGTTANGGSNIYYGTVINGGSGQVYGGVAKHQIDRITYTLSPGDGKINSDIQFGSSLAVSRASATIKQIEQTQDALRQRTL